MKQGLAVFFLTCMLYVGLNAQKGYEIGGWIGTSIYFGDLNTQYRFSDPGPAFGVIGRYDFSNRMALKFSGNYGMIKAQDADSDNSFERARNLSFRSNILDATLQFEFNFFPYVHGSDDKFFTPYLFAGLTGYHFEPKAKYEGEWVKLRSLGTEGQSSATSYSSFQLAFAYGLGVKFDVTPVWSVNVEVSARNLFTDYLDDVSSTYPDLSLLESRNGAIAAALSDRSGEISDVNIGEFGRQRGNSRDNDSYNFISVGIVYFIGILECPDISKPKER